VKTAQDIRTIVLCRGIQASGKSTWSKEQLQRYPGKYKRINKDDLRAMLDNGVFDFKHEKFILSVRDTIAERALWRGHDVIIDDTNFSDKHWNAMCNIAKRIGNVRVMEKFFDCPIEEAVRRNALRPKPVPEGVIRKLFEDKVKGKHIEVRDEFFPKEIPAVAESANASKKPAVIADMDGTLALNLSNRDYYDLTKVLDDTPNGPICKLARILKDSGYTIIIVSGRTTACQEDTETWLKVHDIPYDAIFMREVGDSRKDAITKKEIYQKSIEPHYNVLYTLDDRNSVVNMWREIGLTCLQVNFGDF
jgi:predicted kinase